VADENDDLLNPDEIESLLNSTRGDPSAGSKQPQSSEPTPPKASNSAAQAVASDDVLDPGEIEALLQKSGGSGQFGSTASSPDKLLEQAEADLAAAIAPELGPVKGIPPDLGSASPFRFREFGPNAAQNAGGMQLDALGDVELDLRIELGRTELLIDEVMRLKEGSVVPLDKLAGDPVDILVNGRLVARGEVLVLNDNFCVRVAEILEPDF